MPTNEPTNNSDQLQIPENQATDVVESSWEVETNPGNPSLPSVDSENYPTDSDSALGGISITSSSTASLRSSIYAYVEENGRTYHRQGKYPLPNDETIARAAKVRLATCLVQGNSRRKLYLAPISPDPHRVLDIATGTGIWAIEFAENRPSAHVLGTDLSAIQPLYVHEEHPRTRFSIA